MDEQAAADKINATLAHVLTYKGCARKYMAVSGSEVAAGVEGEYFPESPLKICQRDHAINELLLRYLKSAATDSRYSVLSQGHSQADVVKYDSKLFPRHSVQCVDPGLQRPALAQTRECH